MMQVIYIDEQEAERNNFILQANVSDPDIEVIAMAPEPDLDEMLSMVMETPCDAFIADFKLAEHDDKVTYDGVELVKVFLQRRIKFPCFVLTHYEDEALNQEGDINLIYSRESLGEDEVIEDGGVKIGRENFFLRLVRQIEVYQTELNEQQRKFNELIEKMKETELNAEEVELLLELDHIIESSIDASNAQPSHIKERALKPIDDLMQDTEALIADIKKSLSDS